MPLKFKLLCTVRVHSLLLTSRIALYGCPSLFIHLLIEAYLSYFQFRAIVNSADITFMYMLKFKVFTLKQTIRRMKGQATD